MRKVTALIALLAVAGWALTDEALLASLADRLDLNQSAGQTVARAEPLCPLC